MKKESTMETFSFFNFLNVSVSLGSLLPKQAKGLTSISHPAPLAQSPFPPESKASCRRAEYFITDHITVT